MSGLRLIKEQDKDDLALPVRPWQRLACLLYANGTTLRDISRELERDQREVTEFVTSARGRSILSKLIEANAARLDDLLRASAVDSLLVLVQLRDSGESESIRSRCAIEILNKTRGYASPVKELTKSEAMEDFDNVEEEIKLLREKVEQKT